MYETADAETLEERQRLAYWVRDDLAAAGLTIGADLSISYRIGAEVDVDNDPAGGEWVSWHPHPHLRIAAVQLVAMHHHEAAHDPIVRHAGAVAQAMCDAMLAILGSLGYMVVAPNDELRPYALRIISRPAKKLLPGPEF